MHNVTIPVLPIDYLYIGYVRNAVWKYIFLQNKGLLVLFKLFELTFENPNAHINLRFRLFARWREGKL